MCRDTWMSYLSILLIWGTLKGEPKQRSISRYQQEWNKNIHTAGFRLISCPIWCKNHKNVIVIAVILCPAVFINDVTNQASMFDKGVKYVTSQSFSVLFGNKPTNMAVLWGAQMWSKKVHLNKYWRNNQMKYADEKICIFLMFQANLHLWFSFPLMPRGAKASVCPRAKSSLTGAFLIWLSKVLTSKFLFVASHCEANMVCHSNLNPYAGHTDHNHHHVQPVWNWRRRLLAIYMYIYINWCMYIMSQFDPVERHLAGKQMNTGSVPPSLPFCSEVGVFG